MKTPSSLVLAVALALVPALSQADVDPRFAELRDAAEPVANLSQFLDRFIGECGDPFVGAQCRQNADAFRRQERNKPHYIILDEDRVTMLSNGPYDPGRQVYTVQILPFVSAGSFGLSHGVPKKQDPSGNPVMPLIYVREPTPEGWNAVQVANAFRTRQLRVQLVFTPQEPWSLPKPHGGRIHGVAARFDAILVTVGRTGEPFALWINPELKGAQPKPARK